MARQTFDAGLLVAQTIGITERSSKWATFQKNYLIKNNYCITCGKAKKYTNNNGLQVHHIIPYHICIELNRPDLELDERNLITLCQTDFDIKTENHHLLIGHLNDWESFNKTVLPNAKLNFHSQTSQKIKLNAKWLKKTFKRPKRINDMSSIEKEALKKYINKRFPKK